MDIYRMTHTKDDLCGIQQYTKQSVGPGKYATLNLVPDAKKVNPLSVESTMLYPREGFGGNNKSIDAESVLKNQPEFKVNRCNTRAQARPFLSVPYMGGGRGNPDVESSLIQSEVSRMGKACDTVTETFLPQQFTPLVPSLQQTIQNPNNLIPEVAAPGWIRGGLPSRDYIRDINC
jgi:hypothetical protein